MEEGDQLDDVLDDGEAAMIEIAVVREIALGRPVAVVGIRAAGRAAVIDVSAGGDLLVDDKVELEYLAVAARPPPSRSGVRTLTRGVI